MREQTAVEVLRIENDAVRVGASATAKAQKLTATAEYEAVVDPFETLNRRAQLRGGFPDVRL